LLFENAVYILSDSAKDTPQSNAFVALIKQLGSRILFLNPYLHDKVVANVSHLPQLLSVALVNNANKNSDEINNLDFAAGGFRDMTRIASSDFNIWEYVLQINKNEVLDTIKTIKNELDKISDGLTNNNSGILSEMFDSARKIRDEIPKNTKGFLNPLHDIFVYVKDKPGALAEITSELYKSEINIKDMELLKIREGSGGTFKLSFDSFETAQSAKIALNHIGYKVD